ncbi:MAG: Crp/Fnr family transcriptional regulator [Rhodospirillaceae bacterium]|nr:Crp/Fnr family transcriptional regulator [Rhodospirillaceae bacterium]
MSTQPTTAPRAGNLPPGEAATAATAPLGAGPAPAGAGPAAAGELGQEHKERLLRGSFIFRELSPDLLARLAALSHVLRVPKGALLFQQGDEGDSLYAVMDGLIRITVSGQGGRELIIGLFEPGDVFGEIALLDGLPRTASAEAEEDSTLLVIHRAPFLDLLEKESGLARHVIELLCERLRESTDRLGEYAFLNLRCRLAKKVQALAIAHGRHEPAGIRIDLKLSQTDIAQMLGVTREAVNKQLKAWCQDGLISLDRGYITVRDMQGLGAAAHPTED